MSMNEADNAPILSGEFLLYETEDGHTVPRAGKREGRK